MNKTTKFAIAAVLLAIPVALAVSWAVDSPNHSMPQARNVPAQHSLTDGQGGAGEGNHGGMRTLIVNDRREPAPSPSADELRAAVIKGQMPHEPMLATVMTDEDCSPDAAGVSHCKNRLKLESGRSVTVRHPHKMSKVPCMSPGEKVHVMFAPRS